MKHLLFILLIFVYEANPQSLGFGPCPNYNAQANFDLAQFSGKWYEIYRTFNVYSFTGICQTSFVGGTAANLTITNKQLDALALGDKYQYGLGKITSNGKATVYYPGGLGAYDYTVLATDYNNYAAVCACNNYWLLNLTYCWILSKGKFPGQTDIDKAVAAFKTQGVGLGGMNKTDQFWCNPFN